MFIRLESHEFFGGANHRAFEPVVVTDPHNLRVHFSVGDVSAIPSDEEIQTVCGGCRNVQRIASGFLGKRASIDEGVGQLNDIVPQLKDGKWGKDFKAAARKDDIARSGFIEHDLGNERAEMRKAPLPPISRRGLMPGDDDIAAWQRCIIAGNRGLDVNRRLHAFADSIRQARSAAIFFSSWSSRVEVA